MGKAKAVEFPKKLIVRAEGFADGEAYYEGEPEGREDHFSDGTRVGVYVLVGTGEIHRQGYVNED